MFMFCILNPETQDVTLLPEPTQPDYRQQLLELFPSLRPTPGASMSVHELGFRNDRPTMSSEGYDYGRSCAPSPDDQYSDDKTYEHSSDAEGDEDMPDDDDEEYTDDDEDNSEIDGDMIDDEIESDDEMTIHHNEHSPGDREHPIPPRSRSVTPCNPEIHSSRFYSHGRSRRPETEPDRYDPATSRRKMKDMLLRMDRIMYNVYRGMDEMRHLRDMMTLHMAQAQFFAERGQM